MHVRIFTQIKYHEVRGGSCLNIYVIRLSALQLADYIMLHEVHVYMFVECCSCFCVFTLSKLDIGDAVVAAPRPSQWLIKP